MLLAIDTSTGTSVAVVDRSGVRAVRTSADTRGHAEVIGAFIRDALAEAGASPAELEAVAVGMGPGPFTGLRVGIAAARSFALGIGRPVVPVVSHDAVAFGNADAVLVVTDARRRELAWSRYAAPASDGLPVRIEGPALAPAAALAETVPHYAAHRRIDAATVDAGALGRLALALHDAGAPLGPAEPVYLRAPDVTLSTPKRVTA
ncbi:MAG TPA: tRNA (adenosine(37)-N6)-threonylcarbamoyltransferase complex dimerization subunit type 1 TsaB [Protaetiibacter sp.]|nr:tRNA (adenosine(37)-N6)-threonylcarbamoyltransferase complex dimerization subunit type 1 TsaB [Protaetiibacter sp.]